MTGDFYSGQVVDTPTAREFTERALEMVSREDLGDIAGLLSRKVEKQAPLEPAIAFPAVSVSVQIG